MCMCVCVYVCVCVCVFPFEHQAGNIHVCKNTINKTILKNANLFVDLLKIIPP